MARKKKVYSCSKTLGHPFFCQVVFNCFHRDVTEVHGGLASPRGLRKLDLWTPLARQMGGKAPENRHAKAGEPGSATQVFTAGFQL